jgi:RNA polymerase sigma-70 factor (ECF subfamily)
MEPLTEQEFLRAYDEHAAAIYRHCFFRVYSKEKAEELVQETYLRAWQYLRGGKRVDNLRPFLYRVATNLVIDHVRKHKESSLDALLEENPYAEPAVAGHLDMEAQAAFAEVRRALVHLEPSYREVITMRYLEDMDIAEIAEALGITANNVSVRLNRATAALRHIMEA